MNGAAIPVEKEDFVQENKLDEVLLKCQASGDGCQVAIISGVSGAGKSEIAIQVKKKMDTDYGESIISGRLDCAAKDVLKASLAMLARQADLDVPEQDDLDLLLKETCKALKTKYPHHKKLLIFDDVEISNVLYSIDQNVCKQLGNQRDKWVIIITTQKQDADLYRGCDLINKSSHEVKLNGLADEEFDKFFENTSRSRGLRHEDKLMIKKKIGRLPVFLQVLRANLETDETMNLHDCLQFYLHEENQGGIANPGLNMLHRSFQRILDKVTPKEKTQFESMIKLITTVGEKRVTRELLIAFAEVVLESQESQQSYADAHKLQSHLVAAMSGRSLCDEMVDFAKTKLFNMHSNIRLAMKTFRSKDWQDEAKLILNSLIALTRVIPKDGRERQSSDIRPYLYEHGSLLIEEVKKLHSDEFHLQPDLSITIRLLTASLHAALDYCQQTLSTSEENGQHFSKAITEIAAIIPSVDRPDSDDELCDANWVTRICDGLASEDSPLLNSQYYKDFVDKVVAHSIVTTKDLDFMFENYRHGDDLQVWLVNGHLDTKSGCLKSSRLSEMRAAGKLLDNATMRRIYPLELLAEIYIIASKKTKVAGRATQGLQERRGEAALLVCEKVTERAGIHLMMETVTRRELLKIRMLNPSLSSRDLQQLEDNWKALKDQVDHNAYEYGRVRTNFSRDHYHRDVCVEHSLCCEGRRFALDTAVTWNSDGFNVIRQKFVDLIEEVNSKPRKNFMTISILELHLADFLFSCGDRQEEELLGMSDHDKSLRSERLRDAIQILLDAFIDLRKDQWERTDDSNSPEMAYKKKDKYLKRLKKFLNSYKLNPSDDGLLPNSQENNYQRREYLKETCDYIIRIGDPHSDLSVMFEVARAAGINQYDAEALLPIPQTPED